MPNKKRKTNRNKPRKKYNKNKTKRSKAGQSVFPPNYYTDIAIIKRELNDINENNPNAFREVIDADLDIHHDFAQFRDNYNWDWQMFFNDIRFYYRNMSAQRRLRLFTLTGLLIILLAYPNNRVYHESYLYENMDNHNENLHIREL